VIYTQYGLLDKESILSVSLSLAATITKMESGNLSPEDLFNLKLEQDRTGTFLSAGAIHNCMVANQSQ
jgi:hypothetical protein